MKFKTEQEFLAALYRYFGLNEALRSDQSYEALADEIKTALATWANRPANDMWVRWTFADRVIATAWVIKPTGGEEHHAWEIPYSRGEGDTIVFGTPVEVNQVQLFEPVSESQKTGRGQRQRIIESSNVTLSVIGESATGGKKVKAIGITAGIVNGNGRRYPRAVLADAVARLNTKLNESAGQGRLLLTGEAEHPSDKGGKANILETVFKWDAVSLNAAGQIVLEGAIIPTSKGKDLQVIAESGVPIKLSQRGYGEMQTIKENGQSINEVTYLEITGYDAVANPSDPTAGLTESQQPQEKKQMNLEELLKLLAEKPELKEAIMKQLGLTDPKQLAESLGVKDITAIQQALTEGKAAQAKIEETQRKAAVDAAITEACKDLPYGDLSGEFVEAVRKATPETPQEVKALVEAKRVEWDMLFSKTKLAGMGKTDSGVKVIGPVFERETGQADYTKVAFALNESLIKRGEGHRRNVRKGESPAEIYTLALLERFDKIHQARLIQEAKIFEEAEQTSDLNLPYSVSRMIIEQAYPELVAANVYDFGVAANSPERIYYEAYAGESGSAPTVTDEVVAASHDAWVSLANKRLRPGTVVLTNSAGSTTYVDGTDYVIDYEDGQLYTFSTGAITNAQSLKIDYVYDKFRAGEMVAIQRAKNTLTYTSLDMVADRLATQISREAIVFSRSQMNYDAVTRTLSNLVRLVRRKIDKDIFYKGLGRSLIQASNSGGTWTAASDAVSLLVQYIGVAKTKVYNRFYVPTSIVMSQTNADRLSNWDGFKNDGFPNAVLNAAGFAGSVKGLPIYASAEYPDTHVQVVNRELVAHRVYQPLQMFGPFPSYDSNGNLIGADQYYCEEFNGSIVPVKEKTSHVKVA